MMADLTGMDCGRSEIHAKHRHKEEDESVDYSQSPIAGGIGLNSSAHEKILLATVLGAMPARPPIWIMRQAGRYLPEYREVRAKADGFLDLCYTPDLATEVTLQPLRRFNLDAAIVFSDILVVPDALGQKVAFRQGEGPVLEPVSGSDIAKLHPERITSHLSPVLETIERVRAGLAPEKTLIGFCGAPWTLSTYMIGGKGSSDQAAARLFALQEPEAFNALIDVLVEASITYLVAQLRAGADVVQVFESWAMNLDEEEFSDYVITPNRRIVEGVRAEISDAPIIGFPRGAAGMLNRYAKETGVNVIGLDYSVPLGFAKDAFPRDIGVQGNLDPLRVVSGGKQMEERVREIVAAFKGRPHIFNLGHGIVPQTPIAHVERLVKLVKEGV